MKFWIGVTDNQWLDVVSHIPGIDEVNFWQPLEGRRQHKKTDLRNDRKD
jgi:hypothetical protein